MQETSKRKTIQNIVEIIVIALLCLASVVLNFVKISYVEDDFRNEMISKTIQQFIGGIAGILLMLRLGLRLFGKPQNWLYMLPCLLIAIDNFQFSAYFNGRMELVHTQPMDFVLFAGYCLVVGVFEECIFRGIVFAVLAGCFSKDKRGLLLTYFISSFIFGAAHIFNGFSLGTLLQIGYTVLTGGLFGFCLLKTKNIFCCAFVHALYNFGGMLFDTQGLGSGVVFDAGTVITMVVVGVSVGIFVLYKVFTYQESERLCLYEKLGIKPRKDKENV